MKLANGLVVTASTSLGSAAHGSAARMRRYLRRHTARQPDSQLHFPVRFRSVLVQIDVLPHRPWVQSVHRELL